MAKTKAGTPTAAKRFEVTAADLMRPATTSVERNAHIAAAAYLMKRADASALVVTSDDEQHRPVAIVTGTDVANLVGEGRNLEEMRIADLEKRPPITVSPDAPVAAIAEQMLDAGIHHMIVVDDGSVVGILDMADVCRGLLSVDKGPEQQISRETSKEVHSVPG